MIPGLFVFFSLRLRAIERYDAHGFYGYHVAEHHGTALGRFIDGTPFLDIRTVGELALIGKNGDVLDPKSIQL